VDGTEIFGNIRGERRLNKISRIVFAGRSKVIDHFALPCTSPQYWTRDKSGRKGFVPFIFCPLHFSQIKCTVNFFFYPQKLKIASLVD